MWAGDRYKRDSLTTRDNTIHSVVQVSSARNTQRHWRQNFLDTTQPGLYAQPRNKHSQPARLSFTTRQRRRRISMTRGNAINLHLKPARGRVQRFPSCFLLHHSHLSLHWQNEKSTINLETAEADLWRHNISVYLILLSQSHFSSMLQKLHSLFSGVRDTWKLLRHSPA